MNRESDPRSGFEGVVALSASLLVDGRNHAEGVLIYFLELQY